MNPATKSETLPTRQAMNSVQFGWYVWCVGDDFREPEGTVFFDHEPKVGEHIRLCDGMDWMITRINPESLELNAERRLSRCGVSTTVSLNPE